MDRVLSPALGQRPQIALVLLLGVLALYVVGLDQGWLLSLAQGDIAYAQNLIHETLHDARHAAGFACH
jgi:uncharacterized membrane protein SpoIIM required for sporulation